MERASSRIKKRKGREEAGSGNELSITSGKSNADDALIESQKVNSDANGNRSHKKSKTSNRVQIAEEEPADMIERQSRQSEETAMSRKRTKDSTRGKPIDEKKKEAQRKKKRKRTVNQRTSTPREVHASDQDIDVDAIKDTEGLITSQALRTEGIQVDVASDTLEKSRQKELQAELLELRSEKAELVKQVVAMTNSLEKQKDAMAQIQVQCTCTICLELAWRPHVLSPCGHLFCARCLLSWFKRPSSTEPPMPHYFSPEQRAAEERKRTVRRVKVCPHCRVKVLGQPAEVWTMKSMIETVEDNLLEQHIPEPNMPETSHQDKPIRANTEQRGEDLATGTTLWADIFDMKLARQPIWDVDDHVYRCGSCSSEIVDHQCTNQQCLMMYHPDDFGEDWPEDGLDEDEEAELDWMEYHMYGTPPWGHDDDWSEGEEDWDEDDENFIDDGDVLSEEDSATEANFDGVIREVSSDESDVQEVDPTGAPINRARRRVVATVSDSEDDDADEERVQGPRRRHASPRQLPFSDDEDAGGTGDRRSASTPSIYLGSDQEEEEDGETLHLDNEDDEAEVENSINFEEQSSHDNFSDLEEHNGGSEEDW